MNLTVPNDSANILSLFMDIILIHTNMVVYIRGKWAYM